jgi:hypothetical protein
MSFPRKRESVLVFLSKKRPILGSSPRMTKTNNTNPLPGMTVKYIDRTGRRAGFLMDSYVDLGRKDCDWQSFLPGSSGKYAERSDTKIGEFRHLRLILAAFYSPPSYRVFKAL